MDEREAATVLKALLFFFRRSGYDVVSAAECSLKQNVKKKCFSNQIRQIAAVIGRFHFVVFHVFLRLKTSQDEKNILLPISFLRVNKSSNRCLFSAVSSCSMLSFVFTSNASASSVFSPGEAETNTNHPA